MRRNEVSSLGFPTAHRRRGNCYCVVEVQGGILAYVIMESVREKEEQKGKTVAIVGVFVFP